MSGLHPKKGLKSTQAAVARDEKLQGRKFIFNTEAALLPTDYSGHMKSDLAKKVDIRNKAAGFEFELLDTYEAGIVLTGTEIKSVRQQKINAQDSFCQFKGTELFLINLHISPYEQGTYNNHIPKRERKLLLKKAELRKLQTKMEEKGLAIVLTRIFINDSGRCKVEIALGRGKKLHDKRASIKEKDLDREIRRDA